MDRHLWVMTAMLAALVAAGCASAPRHTSAGKPARASEDRPYDFRSEGNPPPASTDDTPVEPDIEEIPVAEGALEVSEAQAPPPDTTRAAAPADSTTDGFRVQVFATSDREVAENAARVAEQRVGLGAYIDLEDGMYKVRVGDYVTRPDAETALATLRSHYYPDAWIVPARVRVPRAP
jgi:cell division septation protein DedD